MNITDHIARPASIDAAWQRYRNNRGHWNPAVSSQAFSRRPVFYLLELQQDLLSGQYISFQPRSFQINKGDGSSREISAYYSRDKVAQRLIMDHMVPVAESRMLACSYGFRPVCTVDMAVSRLREHVREKMTYILRTDIVSCYESIPIRRLLKRIRSEYRDRHLCRLIESCLQIKTLLLPGSPKGLPQGAVLSPILCNIYLHQIDKAISRIDRRNIGYVRYADDIAIAARTRFHAEMALTRLESSVNKLDLQLNPDKTVIQPVSRNIVFLGKRLPRNTGVAH